MEESRSWNHCFDTHFLLWLYTVCAMIICLLLKSTTLLHPALCLHLTYENFPITLKIPDVVSVLQLTCLETFPSKEIKLALSIPCLPNQDCYDFLSVVLSNHVFAWTELFPIKEDQLTVPLSCDLFDTTVTTSMIRCP